MTRRNFAPGPGARLRIGERVRVTKGMYKGRTGQIVLRIGSQFDVVLDGDGQRRNIHRTALKALREEEVAA